MMRNIEKILRVLDRRIGLLERAIKRSADDQDWGEGLKQKAALEELRAIRIPTKRLVVTIPDDYEWI